MLSSLHCIIELSKHLKQWGKTEKLQEETTSHLETDRKTTAAPLLAQGSCSGVEQGRGQVNCSQLYELLSDPRVPIVTVDNGGEEMGRVRGG